MSHALGKWLSVVGSSTLRDIAQRALLITALRDPDQASSAIELLPKTSRPRRVKDVQPGGQDRLARLAIAVEEVRSGKRSSPRTAKLLAADIAKMAQKLVEEAAETAIGAVSRNRTAVVNESVDLLYNLTVLWSAMNVDPADVWSEMDRRELTLGMAEKLPKTRHGERQFARPAGNVCGEAASRSHRVSNHRIRALRD
jgi:phosphoribosyl-ATP pyrophosphohydrolase